MWPDFFPKDKLAGDKISQTLPCVTVNSLIAEQGGWQHLSCQRRFKKLHVSSQRWKYFIKNHQIGKCSALRKFRTD